MQRCCSAQLPGRLFRAIPTAPGLEFLRKYGHTRRRVIDSAIFEGTLESRQIDDRAKNTADARYIDDATVRMKIAADCESLGKSPDYGYRLFPF